jgi:oligopeptide transport system permease protein
LDRAAEGEGDAVIPFILRRVLVALPVLFIVATLSFLLMRLAPGSPFTKERAIPAAILRQLEAHYNLNGSLPQQYGGYLRDLAHGNLGLSTQYRNRTVNEIIGQTLPVSLTVGAAAFAVALGVGIWVGTYAAVRHNRWGDRAAMTGALLGISLPVFVIAPLAVLLFGIGLRWVPVAGWGSPRQLILPALCLGLPFAAAVARLMRASLLEVLGQDFIRTARAKGQTERKIVYRHALRVALLPVVSYAGPLAANLLTGSIVIETIFALPGIGPFFVNSVLNKDVFMVGGVVLLYSTLLIAFNIVVDVLYAVLDRRVRIS